MPWECWQVRSYLCSESSIVSDRFLCHTDAAFWCKGCSNDDQKVKIFIICGRDVAKMKPCWETHMHRYFSWYKNISCTEPCYLKHSLCWDIRPQKNTCPKKLVCSGFVFGRTTDDIRAGEKATTIKVHGCLIRYKMMKRKRYSRPLSYCIHCPC